VEQVNIALYSGAIQFESTNFEQAWDQNDEKDQETWRMEIKKMEDGNEGRVQ
jgi:hypothetical protein